MAPHSFAKSQAHLDYHKSCSVGLPLPDKTTRSMPAAIQKVFLDPKPAIQSFIEEQNDHTKSFFVTAATRNAVHLHKLQQFLDEVVKKAKAHAHSSIYEGETYPYPTQLDLDAIDDVSMGVHEGHWVGMELHAEGITK